MIKALEKRDLPEIFKIVKENGGSLFANPDVITEENVLNELCRTDPGTSVLFFCIMKGPEISGFMTLNNINPLRQSAYIGNVVVKSGQFLGVRAVRWLIEYSFNTLNLNRVYGHTWSDNPKMDAFYKRLGAVHEGTEREHTWKQGKYVDLKIWGILRREYGTSRSASRTA